MQSEPGSHATAKRGRNLVVMCFLSLFLAAALAGGAWLFFKYRQAVDANPKTVEERTIQRINEMVEAPSEKPSVVTVSDASKLTNKELANRAKNDDKLLIYTENKRIIIFRPLSDKIVDMLTIRDTSDTATPQETVTTQ
ncbi:MAG TPA: hypothetical protein VFB59_00030 [Candidatus Saccharimonadales bacterium]|nr:hypothetical protein [Candidatus Saccharimonadales bacterium]